MHLGRMGDEPLLPKTSVSSFLPLPLPILPSPFLPFFGARVLVCSQAQPLEFWIPGAQHHAG